MSTGFIELTYDGVVIAKEHSTPNNFDYIIGPYLKVGLYDAFDTPNFGTRTAYFRSAEKFDANEDFGSTIGKAPINRYSAV